MIIDQIYSDFTTKLLPEVAKGIEIGKDYFADIFGRYTKYLITVDSIGTGVGLILIITSIISLIKWFKFGKEQRWNTYHTDSIIGLGCLIGFLFLVGSMIFGFSLDSLIKDIFIPEIRIFEIIRQYK